MGQLIFKNTGKYLDKKTKPFVEAADADSVNRLFEAAEERLCFLRDNLAGTLKDAGEDILDSHIMVLKDPVLSKKISENLETSMKMEEAVAKACDSFIDRIKDSDDEYIKERAEDVKEIKTLLLSLINETNDNGVIRNCKGIWVYEEEPPIYDLLQGDAGLLKGVVCKRLNELSHAAIVLKNMNMPVFVSDDSLGTLKGRKLYGYFDTKSNRLYYSEDEELVKEEYGKFLENYDESVINLEREDIDDLLNSCEGCPKISLSVSSVDEIKNNISKVGNGVGLFRSEMLFMTSKDAPSEDYQFEIYKDALINAKGQRVVIRTMDVGFDKPAMFLQNENRDGKLDNLRGVAVSLYFPGLFRTQLRALLRASVYGKLCILFPMILDEHQAEEILKTVEYVKKELENEDVKYDINVNLGAMLETASSIENCKKIARGFDFVSIGTNDLSQDLYRCERGSNALEDMICKEPKRLVHAVKKVCDDMSPSGREVCVCGETLWVRGLFEELCKAGVSSFAIGSANLGKAFTKITEINKGSEGIS